MNRLNKFGVGGWALAVGLGGCGGAEPPVGSTAGVIDSKAVETVEASISASIDRLRSLHIVEVGDLVLELPDEATACYSLPCPGSVWVKPYQEERARQVPRLAHLVELATAVNANPYLAPADLAQAPSAVKALADLRVIHVSGLVETQARSSANCYNLVCPGDQEAADRENGLRITKAQAIADDAGRSGL